MLIDYNEVAKFSNIAKDWWNPSGQFGILHKINPLRLQYIRSLIEAHYKGKLPKELSVADIGCGGGLISIPLARIGYEVTSIDADTEALLVLDAKIKEERLTNIKTILQESDALPPSQYDVVICIEVVEHVADLEDFVAQVTQRVKPGGMIIFSTLNRSVKSWLLAVGVAEYILRWVPRGTHEYTKMLKPSELHKLLRVNGLETREQKGLEYSPLKRTWHLTDNINVNYFVYAAKR